MTRPARKSDAVSRHVGKTYRPATGRPRPASADTRKSSGSGPLWPVLCGLTVGSLCVWNPFGYRTSPAIPTAVGGLFAIVLVTMAMRSRAIGWHRSVLVMLVAVVAAGVSALASNAPVIGLLGAAGRSSGVLSITLGLIAFVAGLSVGADDRRRNTAVVAMAVASWAFAALTVAGRFGLAVVPDPGGGRGSGPLGSAAMSGGALALLLPISFAGLAASRSTRLRRICLCGGGLVLAALISTGARAAWLGTIVVALVGALYLYRTRKVAARTLGLIAFVVTGFSLVTATSLGVRSRVSAVSDSNGTAAGRGALWVGGVRSFPDVWLLGTGPDQQQRVLPRHLDESFERRFNDVVVTDRAHNELIDLFLSVGLVGSLPLVAWWALIGRTLLKRRADPMTVALGCGLLAYVVHMMFNFSVPQVGLVALLIAGVAVAPGCRVLSPSVRPIIPACVVGVALLSPLVRDALADRALSVGIDAERGGDIAAARSAYQSGESLTPWQPVQAEVVARFELRAGDSDSALAAAERARRRSGNDPRWQELEAEMLLASGRFEQAEQWYRDLVNVDARKSSLFEGLGHAQAALGRKAEARVAFEQALRLNPLRKSATAGLAELSP
jgi:Flp pilus assembly protein TadD